MSTSARATAEHHWRTRCEATLGAPYHFTVKEKRALAELHRQQGRDLPSLIDDFSASDDPFIASAGRTVAVFESQANKLAQLRTVVQQPSAMLAAFDWLDARGGQQQGRLA